MAEIAIWICWGIVVVAWIAGALNGARKSRGQRQPSGSGGLWRVGSIVAAVLIYRLTFHDLHRLTDHSLWIELPGLAVLIIATAFTIWARVSLGLMWSATPNMLRAHHELRTDGPYAITRHPIYTGILAMLIGTAVLSGAGRMIVAVAVGAVYLNDA